MKEKTIQTDIQTDSGDVSVQYRKTEEAWQVNTEEIDGKGWRDYAVPEADHLTVIQLLRKDYDNRY